MFYYIMYIMLKKLARGLRNWPENVKIATFGRLGGIFQIRISQV